MKKYTLIKIGYDDWYDPTIETNLTDIDLLDSLYLYENLKYHKNYSDTLKIIEDIDNIYKDYLDLYIYYKEKSEEIIYICLSVDENGHVEREWPKLTKEIIIAYLKTI